MKLAVICFFVAHACQVVMFAFMFDGKEIYNNKCRRRSVKTVLLVGILSYAAAGLICYLFYSDWNSQVDGKD